MKRQKILLFSGLVLAFAIAMTGCSEKMGGNTSPNSLETQGSLQTEEVTDTSETEETTTTEEVTSETTTEEVTETAEELLTEADIELDGIPYEELTPEQVVKLYIQSFNNKDARVINVIQKMRMQNCFLLILLWSRYPSVLTSRYQIGQRIQKTLMKIQRISQY